jgi:hypothetical protein
MAALHGLFALVVWWEMQPRPAREVAQVPRGEALQVRLIAQPRATQAPPPAVPAPPPPRPPAVRERPRPDAMTASLPAAASSAPTSPPRLYDRTGQLLLPTGPTTVAAPSPGYVQRMPQGDSRVMSHDTPVKYKATRFEKYFPPPDETIVGEGGRSLRRATHSGESRAVNLGHGIHLKCKTLFGIPTPDCVMPPAPPSRKDGDERLDMAPAPLAKELAPAPRKLSECIAIYRAGKPLPQGCPVDTPARAVDAECGEARRAGNPLPTHCRKP